MSVIREVIVVEGVNDSKRIKMFFDADTIETHGLGLNRETIELIRLANEKRGVILFLDPDHPGEKIRQRLNEEIPGLKNAFIMKEDGRTKKKVGIEHASREVLSEALNHLLSHGEWKDSLSREEFYELGLQGDRDSTGRREIIARRCHLGHCNAKTLFRRLNMLGITAEELRSLL